MSWLGRLFCRHRNQGEPFQAGDKTYFRCRDCDAVINVDRFFEDEPSDASTAGLFSDER